MIVVERRIIGGKLFQCFSVGEEQSPKLRGRLEACLTETFTDHGIVPLAGEALRVVRATGSARPDQHPLEPLAGPQRAILESRTERSDDGPTLVSFHLVDGQPIGGDAAIREPVTDELEVLLGVQIHDASGLGRRRFRGDDVVMRLGRR